MLKECVIFDGQIINIGPWDYKIQPFEVEPAEYDAEGNLIKEAVYEDRETNPFPEGATIEQRDFDYHPDLGWYEVGTVVLQSPEQRIAELEQNVADLTQLLAEKGITQ